MLSRLPLCLPLVLLLGCPSEKGDTTDAAATTGTATATDGATDTTGTADADTTVDAGTTAEPTGGAGDDADFLELSMCEPKVCLAWEQAFAEGEPYGDSVNAECVFIGLRDGTPGQYRYVSDHEFGNGHTDTTALFVVHADREVTVVIERDSVIEPDGASTTYDESVRCTLADAAYFTACLDDPFNCTWFNDSSWWTACAPAAPAC